MHFGNLTSICLHQTFIEQHPVLRARQYWQQRADHKIKVTLNEANQSISATQSIEYTNNSPDTLRYIWIQLDQNRFAEGSIDRLTRIRE